MILKVIEGKVGNVFVEGNKYFSPQIYQDAILRQKDRVFRYQDLEQSLYFLNQKPDRKVKAYLIAGSEPATSDIILKVEEKNPVHVYYDFSNRGSKLTHYERHGANFEHYNITGHDDTLHVGFTGAAEGAIKAYSFSYSVPIDSKGTTFDLDGSFVQSMLIGPLKPLEVKGNSVYLYPKISYPFIKTPVVNLEGNFGFEFKNSISRIDDIQTSADRMRTVIVGPALSVQDPSGRTLISGDAHFGIPDILSGLAAVDTSSTKVNTGGEFLYYTGSVARIQRLPEGLLLVLRANGQWTRDKLASSEQYRAGGAYTVRGYGEGDSSGDYGCNITTELVSPVPFIPDRWQIPAVKKKVKDAVRMVVFVDGGRTFFRERVDNTDVKDRSLLGAGFGIRVDLDKTLSLQVDLGYPLGDPSSDNKHMQLHISFRSGF